MTNLEIVLLGYTISATIVLCAILALLWWRDEPPPPPYSSLGE